MRMYQVAEYIFFVLFQKNITICVIFLSVFFALLFATALAMLLRSVRISGALNCLCLAGGAIAAFFCRLSLGFCYVYFAVLIATACVLYLFVALCLHIRKAWQARKRKRANWEKKLQFTLPDKDNAFVRARLNTVLSLQEKTDDAEWVEERKQDSFTLSHARELLVKLKNKNLSLADRLETDEIAQTLKLYVRKENLTANDLRAVNDTLACLLKLSAKYAV